MDERAHVLYALSPRGFGMAPEELDPFRPIESDPCSEWKTWDCPSESTGISVRERDARAAAMFRVSVLLVWFGQQLTVSDGCRIPICTGAARSKGCH